jgi:hypothetical protein
LIQLDLGAGGGLNIYFRRVENRPPEEANVEQLRRAYEEAVHKLHLVARNENQFMPIFNRILSSAESSLATSDGKVSDGSDELAYIKRDILRLGRRRRNGYFFWIFLCGIVTSVVGLLLWLIAAVLIPKYVPLSEWGYADSYKSALVWLVPAILILPGAALGIVFVGFASNRIFTYEAIGPMDQYDFVPWVRFTWIIIIAYVLFAAVWFDLFVIGVGNMTLNQVKKDYSYGFLIGLVCGVAEAVVVEMLMTRLRPVAAEGRP